jgi:Trk K+ transport system NAD-binding subunit
LDYNNPAPGEVDQTRRRVRSTTGTLVLGIVRGSHTLNNPTPDEPIRAGDRLVLTGSKEQLGKAMLRRKDSAAGPLPETDAREIR